MYIRVKVKAGERKEKVEKKGDCCFHISVKEKAENNLANDRVCEIVASMCEVDKKKVRIVTGHHKNNKLLFLNN